MNMRARTLTIVTAHTNIITQVLLVAMAVASMDHRGIHRGIDSEMKLTANVGVDAAQTLGNIEKRILEYLEQET